MRKMIVVLCALSLLAFSLEAKRKIPASQNTTISKAHRKAVKQIVKSRKAPKMHPRQHVN